MTLLANRAFKVRGIFSPLASHRSFRTAIHCFSLETHYDILEVTSTANSKEIREAYLKKCKEFHPDKNVDDNDDNFKRIKEAYETLIDVQRRTEYDNSFHSFDEEFGMHPNARYRELWNYRERAQAYGFPESDADYFKKFSPNKIALACFAFAISGFFIHLYIAYLGYGRNIRNLERIRHRFLQNDNSNIWTNRLKSRGDLREQEYTEEAIERRKELDALYNYGQLNEEEETD